MTLLSARGVTQHAGDRVLFDRLELTLEEGARVALVGHNGSGKTTLLSLLARERVPDAGEVTTRRGLVVGRVEQFLPAALEPRTALDAVLDALPADRRHERWVAESRLASFGFAPDELDFVTGELSGGQQNRLMLARALVREPELLLLDEPTNHLDLATLEVFEEVLRAFPGSLVLVSHDRAFLDAVTTTTLFLRDGRLYRFDLPYSQARVALDEADAAARDRRRAEDRKIEDLRESAKRLALWGKVYDNEKLARRARNMERRIERLEAERTFVTDGSPLDLALEARSLKAKEVLRLVDLMVYSPGDEPRPLFHVPELLIRPGERVGLLGANGAGKSTLIRRLVDVARNASRIDGITLGPQVTLGYYDQELTEASGDETIAEYLSRRSRADDVTIRQRLIGAGFAYRDHVKRVSTMSGGERARLLFILLSLEAPNFLVLDEPTNHIDIDGREQLEAQLLASPAAALITAHDRHFLDRVVERWWWIRNGTLIEVHEPDEFYRSLGASRPARASAAAPASGKRATPQHPQDALLERIVEIEAKLEADRARKARFQKPALQAQWQRELEELYRQIDERE
jgi:ATPase subunit of ABC transporter with duplicated ATPase domains